MQSGSGGSASPGTSAGSCSARNSSTPSSGSTSYVNYTTEGPSGRESPSSTCPCASPKTETASITTTPSRGICYRTEIWYLCGRVMSEKEEAQRYPPSLASNICPLYSSYTTASA